jgi:hypothetical protein
MFILNLLLIIFSTAVSATVPLSDNILFGFEKCKTLSVDLEKGLLKETPVAAFDIHCQQQSSDKLKLDCSFFEFGSNKKKHHHVFSGGSELGEAHLKDNMGNEIRFLIGKKFASYHSVSEQKVCAGIFIFERDALKQKASSPKSD